MCQYRAPIVLFHFSTSRIKNFFSSKSSFYLFFQIAEMAYLRTFFCAIKLEIKFKILSNFISRPCFGPSGNKVRQYLSTLFPVHVYIHDFEFLILIPLKIWRVCLYPDLISQMLARSSYFSIVIFFSFN